MQYKILDKTSVISYLLGIEDVVKFFEDDNLEASEIGDGNLNFVYIVSSKKDPSKSLIVKQAVPYLRCVGEEFPLGRQRMTYEIRALEQFKQIAPSFIPNLYHTSEEMSVVVMQYLGDHQILRYDLIDKKYFPNFADHISTYLANTLFLTSSLHLSSKEKRELIDKFNSNTELCKLTEDFVFTFAFMQNETNDIETIKQNQPLANKIFNDNEFKTKVLELKYKFMTQNDALLHGDLHTGSIMLNSDETYVIDPEFAFVGPFGFDIGALIANMVSAYVHHKIVTKDQEYQIWLLQTIKDILNQFETKFLDLWDSQKDSALLVDNYIDKDYLKEYQKAFVKNIIQDSIGFAGCKLARRIFGVAGVVEIRGIEDKELKIQAQNMIFDIAKQFVIYHNNINNIDEIISTIKDKTIVL